MVDPALAIAAPIICQFEGFRSEPYPDTGGVWTQGYGCTFHPDGAPVRETDPPVTKGQAQTWMEAIAGPTMSRVRDLVRVKISDNAAAALCSFAYNTGTGNLSRSTLLQLLNEGAPLTQVAGQFAAWVHDSKGNVDAGLVRRRAVEAALLLKPDAGPLTAKIPPVPALDPQKTAVSSLAPDADEMTADELDALYNPGPST
jgi:lysozyme